MSVSSFPQGTIAASAVGTVVTLSGESVTDSLGPTATAGVRFNASGTVDKNDHGSYSQIDAATDWIIPNGDASSSYSIKAVLNSQTGPGTRTGTLGTWLDLGINREWKISRGTTGLSTWNLQISISDDGGTTTIATAAYNLAVDPP